MEEGNEISSGLEIERKFWVGADPYNVPVELFTGTLERKLEIISQTYLVTGNSELRLRRVISESGSKYFLTYKAGSGLVRKEKEIEVDEYTFNSLNKNNLIYLLKHRYNFQVDGFKAVYDIYHDFNLGIVEVEFNRVEEAESFAPPNWFGLEVTGESKYKAQTLWVMLRSGLNELS